MDIQIFENEKFGQIRTTTDESGEPIFCLTDVCRVLDLVTSKVVQRLSDDVLSKYPIADSIGRRQLANFVNEDGLYDVILDSRKPEAKKFRKWVTSVVLPQIRKTGGYIPLNENENENSLMARALLIAQKTIELKNRELVAQKPKVMFADAVTSCEDSILIRDMAKLLAQNGVVIGQNRLFSWLREKGYLFQHETRPIQKWVEKGLFDTTISIIETPHGTIERITTKVTGKGQRYFVEKFLGEEESEII